MKYWKTMSKRGLSLFLTLVMCLGMLNLTAFAMEEHVHNEGGWTCTQAEGTRQLVCEAAEHTHGEECYTAGEPELTCGEDEAEGHTHGADCWGEAPLTCGDESEEHEHTEDCYGEAPLTCGKDETEGHAHGEECYTEGESVLTCEAAEHTHGEECYTVTEGAWTCTAPEVEETPAEVQAFLDAVAKIPADVNADNAAEVGAYVSNEVADAYEALLGTEYAARADVQEAAAVWTAAVEAVQAALDMESNGYVTTETGVVKSAFSEWIPNTNRYNIVGNGWTQNEAETGYGRVVLLNAGDTAVDSATPEFWGGHYTFVPRSYGASLTKVVSNSNPGVATADVTWEGGKLIVTFTKGTEVGVTTIKVGYHVNNAHVTSGIAADNDVQAVNGYLVYTVGNSGEGSGGSVLYENETYDYFVIDLDTGNWTRGKSYGATNASSGNFLTGNPPYVGYFYSRNGYGTTYPQKILGADITNTDESVARVSGMELRYGNATDWYGGKQQGYMFDFEGLKPGETTITATSRYQIADTSTGRTVNARYVHKFVVKVINSQPSNDITLSYYDGNVLKGEQTGPAGSFTTLAPLAKDGYTFKGWAETANSTTVKWEAGTEYTFDKDTDLYAVWEENSNDTYTVVYTDGVPGEIVFADQSYEDQKEGGKTPEYEDEKTGLDKPTRDGYTFMGWNPAVNPVVSADDANNDGEIIYTATWQKLKINGIEKKLVESEAEAEKYGLTVTDISYPNDDGKIIIPEGGSVTLLYKITITGEAGAKYKVTDTGATWVSGPQLDVENTIPAGGTAVIYVTKSFNASDINSNGNVVNTAIVTPGKDNESSSSSTETTPAAVPTTYTVVHEYYTNGTKDGETRQSDITGKYVGDTVTAEDIEKVYTYTKNGVENNYTFTSSTPTLPYTLTAGPNTITLRYDRTTTDPPVKPVPQIVVEKTNDGLQWDEESETLKVNYTVKITNESGYAIYGLRLTDIMNDPELTKVNETDVGEPSVKLTFSNWSVDGKSIEPISGGKNDLTHVLQLIARGEKYEKGQTVTLTYTVEVENTNDEVAVKVNLRNEAEGGSWSKDSSLSPITNAAVAAFRAAVMPLTDDTDPPDVVDKDDSEASTDTDKPDVTAKDDSSTGDTTGGSGSETEGVFPRKYKVTYKWNLPEGATGKTLPDETKYFAGKPVTVDTENKKDDTVTVGGATWSFSGWTVPETVTVENGQFTMPEANVVIEGIWTKTAVPPTPMEIKVKYLVQWFNKDTGAAIKTQEFRGPEAVGTEVNVRNEDKVIEGYTFDTGNANNVEKGTLSRDEVVILKLYFIKNPEKITATWLPGYGENDPLKTEQYDKGTTTVPTNDYPADPTREGYTFTNWGAPVIDQETGNITITAQWRSNGGGGGGGGGTTRYTLTVNYVYEGGTRAAPTHTERLERGDSYSVDSPVIDGFTPDQAVVSGTMPGRSLTVTVTYTANQVNLPDENPPLIDEPGTDDPTDNPPVVDIPDENPPLIDEPTIDIPDENPPLVDEPVIDIPEEDPPLVDIPENDPPLVDVPGDEPKLDGTPKTGDSSRTALWAGLCAVSLTGIAVLTGKKKEDEEA